MRVFLIGFMAAGKTVVGKRLAPQLGYRFVDLDGRIENAAGMPVRVIFERHGESRFRSLERQQLVEVAGEEQVVVATGGGTPLAAANRRTMRNPGSTIAWLDPSFETILQRMDSAGRQMRPLFGRTSEARTLFDEREKVYRQVADIRIAIADDESVDETASRLVETIRERQCAI